MYSFDELKSMVDSHAEKLFKFNKEPEGLYSPVSYILSIGGKRIRPVLTLMSVDLFEGNVEKAIIPALGIEMFHNFTLVHDDIMDKADVRRGKMTVHKKWDENRAILSGDAMLLLANQMMLHVDDDVLREVMELYNATGLLVCEGQQYDMNYENEDHISSTDYLRMIELKTAVLLGGCLKLGAVLAKTSPKNKEMIEKFGILLGLSFQIEDDYLDTFGDFDKFGKSIGGDILINKKTFLLVKAIETASGKSAEQLNFWLKASDFKPEEKIKAIRSIFQELGIDKLALETSRNYFTEAMNTLRNIDVNDIRKEPLSRFAHSLIGRSS